MSVVHPNINKTTIQVINSPQFPSIPSKWTDRFDVRIWNELESISNDALAQITSNKRKPQCTIILVGIWTTMFILANTLIGVYAGDQSIEYCCHTSQYGCEEWCYDGGDYGSFIASMVFYALSGFTCFFICPFVIHYDFYAQKNKQQITSSSPVPQQKNMSIEHKVQIHFNSLNEKYQNMILFKILSVHIPSRGCKCCASPNHQSNITYFELEIEMRVQQITYISDIQQVHQVNSLPTQQQIQSVGSLPTQKQIQIVSSLPTQQQMSYGNQGFQQKNYNQWTSHDVLNWMMQLDNGQFVIYQQRLAETLNVEQIDGNDLLDLDKDDLHRLGIQNFKLKKALLAHIQSLSQPAAVYQDSYGVPTVPSDLMPSAPGSFNEINIEKNLDEGAMTHS